MPGLNLWNLSPLGCVAPTWFSFYFLIFVFKFKSHQPLRLCSLVVVQWLDGSCAQTLWTSPSSILCWWICVWVKKFRPFWNLLQLKLPGGTFASPMYRHSLRASVRISWILSGFHWTRVQPQPGVCLPQPLLQPCLPRSSFLVAMILDLGITNHSKSKSSVTSKICHSHVFLLWQNLLISPAQRKMESREWP